MNHSMPGLPVHHQLPEFTQTHAHRVRHEMPSSHLILCQPLLLLPPIPPSIRVFSNESTLRMRWPSIGISASASIRPMNTQYWFPLGWTSWISLQSWILINLPGIYNSSNSQRGKKVGISVVPKCHSYQDSELAVKPMNFSLYWRIVDLWCVSFWCGKVIQQYIHILYFSYYFPLWFITGFWIY